jgi:hypothetical protein
MSEPLACPRCGYLLRPEQADVRGWLRCPECGLPSELAALLVPRQRPVPFGTAPIVLTGVLLGPVGFAASAAFATVGGQPLALDALFPFSALAFRLLPPDPGALLGGFVGVLQGPLYGFALGMALPVRQHARAWWTIGGVHAAAAVLAALIG